jgi:hypothetical protein
MSSNEPHSKGLDARGKCLEYRTVSFKGSIGEKRMVMCLRPGGHSRLACHVCENLENEFAHTPDEFLMSTLIARPVDATEQRSPLSIADVSEKWQALAPHPRFFRTAKGEATRQARRDAFIATWSKYMPPGKKPSEFHVLGGCPSLEVCHKFWGRNLVDPRHLEVSTRGKTVDLLRAPALLRSIADKFTSPVGDGGAPQEDDDDIQSPPRAGAVIGEASAPPILPSLRVTSPPPPRPAPEADVEAWKAYGLEMRKALKKCKRETSILLQVAEAVEGATNAINTATLVPMAARMLQPLLASLARDIGARIGFKSVRVDESSQSCRVEEALESAFAVGVTNSQDVETAEDLAGSKLRAMSLRYLLDPAFEFPVNPRTVAVNWVRLAAQWIVMSWWAGSSGPDINEEADADHRRIAVLRVFRRSLEASGAVMVTTAFGPPASKPEGATASFGCSHTLFKQWELGTLKLTVLSAPTSPPATPAKPPTVEREQAHGVQPSPARTSAGVPLTSTGIPAITALGSTVQSLIAAVGKMTDAHSKPPSAAEPKVKTTPLPQGQKKTGARPPLPPRTCMACKASYAPAAAGQKRCTKCSAERRTEIVSERKQGPPPQGGPSAAAAAEATTADQTTTPSSTTTPSPATGAASSSSKRRKRERASRRGSVASATPAVGASE